MAIKTTMDLREMLVQTIEGVRQGKIDYRQAIAISNLSSKIIQSAKLDLEHIKYNKKNASEGRPEVLQLVNI